MNKFTVLLIFVLVGLAIGIVLTVSEYNDAFKRATWVGPVLISLFALGLGGMGYYKFKHTPPKKNVNAEPSQSNVISTAKKVTPASTATIITNPDPPPSDNDPFGS
jgi:hypothetical protein